MLRGNVGNPAGRATQRVLRAILGGGLGLAILIGLAGNVGVWAESGAGAVSGDTPLFSERFESAGVAQELDAVKPASETRRTTIAPTPFNGRAQDLPFTAASSTADAALWDDSTAMPSTLGQSVDLGDNGSFQMSANPDPSNASVGTTYNLGNRFGWIRAAQIGAYASEQQLLYTAGGLFSLFERDGLGAGLRAMMTGNDFIQDTSKAGFTGDLFAGGRFRTDYGEHWFKGSIFYDYAGHFNRVGPAFAALFFANEKNPVTADFAMGFGGGQDILFNNGQNVFENATRDYQLRLGMFLTPRHQVGVTTNMAEYSKNPVYDNIWGGGAFCNFYQGPFRLGLDLSGAQTGVRGFANLSYYFGGSRYGGRPCKNAEGWCLDGQSWLMQPVERDIGLRLRRRTRTAAERGNGVGNLIAVSALVRFQDVGRSGPIQPGDAIEIVPCVTAGGQNATNVVIAPTAPVIIGPASLASADYTTNIPVVAAGQTVCEFGSGDFDISINTTATGSIIVQFVVNADGESRTFQLAPLTVGVTSLPLRTPVGDTGLPVTATPIN